MPVYEFRCEPCRHEVASKGRIPPICSRCGVAMRRVYGFHTPRPMAEHFNATTGQWVRTDRQFRTQLAEMAHRQDENVGATIKMASHYEPVDPSTPEAYGVTEEGMDVTRRAQRDSGRTESTKRIIT